MAARFADARMAVAIEAGHIIMGLPEFPPRVHADVVYHPSHYDDPDGKEIWDIVCEYFGWDRKKDPKAFRNLLGFCNPSRC